MAGTSVCVCVCLSLSLYLSPSISPPVHACTCMCACVCEKERVCVSLKNAVAQSFYMVHLVASRLSRNSDFRVGDERIQKKLKK